MFAIQWVIFVTMILSKFTQIMLVKCFKTSFHVSHQPTIQL
jgi:hypothetical protein